MMFGSIPSARNVSLVVSIVFLGFLAGSCADFLDLEEPVHVDDPGPGNGQVPPPEVPPDTSTPSEIDSSKDPNESDDAKLILWLDASNLDSMTLSGSDRVAAWSDQSGSGHDAIQSILDNQPVLRSDALGGKPTLRFDSPQSLEISDRESIKPGSLTLIIVCRSFWEHSNVIGYPIWNAAHDQVRAPYWQWVLFHARENRVNVRIDSDAGETATNTNWSKHAVYSYRTWERDFFRNGKLFFLGEPHRNIAYPPNGPGVLIGDLGFHGEVAEIRIYKGSLSDARRLEIEGNLFEKWGIAKE